MRSETSTLRGKIEEFVAAFNVDNLDAVMKLFADDAEYEPGDGNTWRGPAEIRAAFEPQFSGAFGKMRFDIQDMIVDEENRTLALSWICRHDLHNITLANPGQFLQRILISVLVGQEFGWLGVDLFEFDRSGLIVRKRTFANYGKRPQLRRDLGIRLLTASASM